MASSRLTERRAPAHHGSSPYAFPTASKDASRRMDAIGFFDEAMQDMEAYLESRRPKSASAAFSLLTQQFPSSPPEVRQHVCEAYALLVDRS